MNSNNILNIISKIMHDEISNKCVKLFKNLNIPFELQQIIFQYFDNTCNKISIVYLCDDINYGMYAYIYVNEKYQHIFYLNIEYISFSCINSYELQYYVDLCDPERYDVDFVDVYTLYNYNDNELYIRYTLPTTLLSIREMWNLIDDNILTNGFFTYKYKTIPYNFS